MTGERVVGVGIGRRPRTVDHQFPIHIADRTRLVEVSAAEVPSARPLLLGA